MSTIKLILF